MKKTLTEEVLGILQNTKRSTLILSEVIRIDEFKTAFEQAVKERDSNVIGGNAPTSCLLDSAYNQEKEKQRKRAEKTI